MFARYKEEDEVALFFCIFFHLLPRFGITVLHLCIVNQKIAIEDEETERYATSDRRKDDIGRTQAAEPLDGHRTDCGILGRV